MLTNHDEQIIRELKMDFKFKYFEQIMKDYFKEALEEFFKDIKQGDEAKNPLMTIEDVARKFRVTKATIHNWKNKGSIVGQKFGKNRYFTEDEVRKSMAKYGFTKQWDSAIED